MGLALQVSRYPSLRSSVAALNPRCARTRSTLRAIALTDRLLRHGSLWSAFRLLASAHRGFKLSVTHNCASLAAFICLRSPASASTRGRRCSRAWLICGTRLFIVRADVIWCWGVLLIAVLQRERAARVAALL